MEKRVPWATELGHLGNWGHRSWRKSATKLSYPESFHKMWVREEFWETEARQWSSRVIHVARIQYLCKAPLSNIHSRLVKENKGELLNRVFSMTTEVKHPDRSIIRVKVRPNCMILNLVLNSGSKCNKIYYCNLRTSAPWNTPKQRSTKVISGWCSKW